MDADTTTTAAPTVTTALAEYQPTAAALADLRQRFKDVAWDLSTTKGDKEARAARLELVRLRTALEAKRKELKAPALERSRLIDDEAKRITSAILELETPIDEQIKAAEAKREAERQARAEAERQRVAAIHLRIETMKAVAHRAVGKPAEDIEAKIKLVVAMTIGDDYAELRSVAEAAHAQTLQTLRDLHAKAVEHEAEQARLAAERAELERLRAEQAERDRVERERIAAERAELERQQAAARAEQERIEREAEEARRLADEKAAVERAEADRIAREALAVEQRRLAAQRAEIETQQRMAEEARRAEAERIEAERRAAEEAAAAARDRLHAAADKLLAALVIAVPYVADHGSAEELAQCNEAIEAAA